MGDTEISWTHRPGTRGRTWNPVQGCSRISAGCQNCYAERLAARFAVTGWSQGLINLKARKWNGTLRIAQHKLADPLRWREPSTVFVNSMSDLFHKGVDDAYIAQVFDVIRRCPQHTFQVLTKRADRLASFFRNREVPDNAWLGVSVEDRRYGVPRIAALRQVDLHVEQVDRRRADEVARNRKVRSCSIIYLKKYVRALKKFGTT